MYPVLVAGKWEMKIHVHTIRCFHVSICKRQLGVFWTVGTTYIICIKEMSLWLKTNEKY